MWDQTATDPAKASMLSDTSRMLAIKKSESDVLHANQCTANVASVPTTVVETGVAPAWVPCKDLDTAGHPEPASLTLSPTAVSPLSSLSNMLSLPRPVHHGAPFGSLAHAVAVLWLCCGCAVTVRYPLSPVRHHPGAPFDSLARASVRWPSRLVDARWAAGKAI